MYCFCILFNTFVPLVVYFLLNLYKLKAMINYGGGISKTNKSLKEMNKKGKHLMGGREMPVVKAKTTKPSPKKKSK